MRPARLRGGIGKPVKKSNTVEAKNPALRKKRAPDRAGGASGATRYLLYPLQMGGGKGLCGRYGLSDTYLTYAAEDQAETRAAEERTREA